MRFATKLFRHGPATVMESPLRPQVTVPHEEWEGKAKKQRLSKLDELQYRRLAKP